MSFLALTWAPYIPAITMGMVGVCEPPSFSIVTAKPLDQPKVSALKRGRISVFSLERLVRFLILLGLDVEIVVKNAAGQGVDQPASWWPRTSHLPPFASQKRGVPARSVSWLVP